MTEYHFESHRPASLYVEIGKGSVQVVATDTTESYVEVTGRDAADVRVTQDGDEITVVAPRMRSVDGTVGTAKLKSGSGEVRVDTLAGPAVIETGSGDILVDEARGELRIKSGSGSINLGQVASSVAVSTGSGDVEIGTTNGPTVVKTGSGDLKVADARTDVSLTTGSGDFVIGAANRGRLSAKGASGDVHVGIPAGIPVWTDISTVSGEIHSNLHGAGEPGEGADHVELRAKTVSGDIVLTEV